MLVINSVSFLYCFLACIIPKKLKFFLKMAEHQDKMESINNRIKQELCSDTLSELSDVNLLKEYENCPSVIKQTQKLQDIILKYTDEETKQKILQDYLLELIPPGTKGVIRGNRFNKIVKDYILAMEMDQERFDICFEKKCEHHLTTEIPDAYIMEKSTKKIIIMMNQLDLWQGGQQLNRGFKYIIDNKHNNENSKLLCVVCNDIQFKSQKGKAYKLFETGFKNNTLCYLKNLKNIILKWFG